MDILNKLKTISIPRMIGIIFLGVIVLSLAIWFIGFAFRTAFYGGGMMSGSSVSPSYDMMGYQSFNEDGMMMKEVSTRNVMMEPGYTTGNDAEDFEVTEYYGNIRTRKFDDTCEKIDGLKSLDYVIFEDRQNSENYCNFTFKVTKERSEEVLDIIKDLKPETLQANTRTIKNIVDDYTSEIDILEKKLTSLEKTLSDAQSAYDDITVLATRTQDVESLAKIIDSKIQLIERLTTERINIKEQIDRLNRSKAEQLDRLEYTFFNINVSKVYIFDFKDIKNSWVNELKQFVYEFNNMLQDITVNLASYILKLIQIAIYLLRALSVIKYGWRFVKIIWKK